MPLMRRYRRGSHSSDAPNAADWAAKVQKLQSPTLQALLKEYVDFPVNQNLCSSIFHFIPSLLPPFLYRRRWIEYVLFCGPTLKSSLLEELSMHIVIEALLVTIICQPLLGDLADPEGIRAGIMYILLYLSCVLQLVCISVHIITVIAIISLDESLVLEWAADKIDAFAVAGYLHTRSYFSFVACVGAWPLLIISGEDPYYVKWICLAVFVVCFLISSLPNGSIGIINSILFPQLQLLHYPDSIPLRKSVERNVLLLTRGLNVSLVPSEEDLHASVAQDIPTKAKRTRLTFRVNGSSIAPSLVGKPVENEVVKILTNLDLQKYEEVFREQCINDVGTLCEMDNNDYATLGVTIGDRVRIKKYLDGVRRMNS